MRSPRNTFSRRRFLGTGLAAWAGIAAAPAAGALTARIAEAAGSRTRGYGELVPDPNGLLDLPEKFDYVVLSRVFDPAAGGGGAEAASPALPDGMGAFPGLAEVTVLVRNHEIEPGGGPGLDTSRRRPYDERAAGGTTTLWVDSERRLVRSFASLSGTLMNCSGGATPWGSWLSCEECTFMPGPDDPDNHDRTPMVSKPHGYVFEVDARAEGLVDPVPIRAMGRFMHEAAAVDPGTGIVYMSEDRPDGLFYRYRPDVLSDRRPGDLRPGDLARGGTLEALRIEEHPGALTQNWNDDSPLRPGRRYVVDWVRIAEPDPEADMERDASDPEPDPLRKRGRTGTSAVRAQGFRLGAAQFGRAEGIVYQRGAVYLSTTEGGAARTGQLWRFDPLRGELVLWAEPGDPDLLVNPDNLCAAPWGDLLACEDGMGYNRLVGITGSRRYYPIARCPIEKNEIAGACFSPDGRTLFLNTMNPGATFAVRGPWRGL